jgi:hypothetical protein
VSPLYPPQFAKLLPSWTPPAWWRRASLTGFSFSLCFRWRKDARRTPPAGFWSLTLHLGRLGQEGCLIGLEVINTFNSNVSSGRLDLGDQFLHKIRSGRKAASRTGPAQSGPPFFSPSRLRQHKFSLLSVCVDTAKRPRSHGAHTAFLTCFAPRFHFETKKSIFQKGKR